MFFLLTNLKTTIKTKPTKLTHHSLAFRVVKPTSDSSGVTYQGN